MTEASHIEVDSEGHARIEGELTLDTVASVFAQANQAASQGRHINSVNLDGVARVDSSGLALLLEWQSVAKLAGRSIAIHSAPAGLLSLASLCEAGDLLALQGRENHPKGDFQLLQEASL